MVQSPGDPTRAHRRWPHGAPRARGFGDWHAKMPAASFQIQRGIASGRRCPRTSVLTQLQQIESGNGVFGEQRWKGGRHRPTTVPRTENEGRLRLPCWCKATGGGRPPRTDREMDTTPAPQTGLYNPCGFTGRSATAGTGKSHPRRIGWDYLETGVARRPEPGREGSYFPHKASVSCRPPAKPISGGQRSACLPPNTLGPDGRKQAPQPGSRCSMPMPSRSPAALVGQVPRYRLAGQRHARFPRAWTPPRVGVVSGQQLQREVFVLGTGRAGRRRLRRPSAWAKKVCYCQGACHRAGCLRGGARPGAPSVPWRRQFFLYNHMQPALTATLTARRCDQTVGGGRHRFSLTNLRQPISPRGRKPGGTRRSAPPSSGATRAIHAPPRTNKRAQVPSPTRW